VQPSELQAVGDGRRHEGAERVELLQVLGDAAGWHGGRCWRALRLLLLLARGSACGGGGQRQGVRRNRRDPRIVRKQSIGVLQEVWMLIVEWRCWGCTVCGCEYSVRQEVWKLIGECRCWMCCVHGCETRVHQEVWTLTVDCRCWMCCIHGCECMVHRKVWMLIID
jgi:hypothetical protein